MLFEPIGRMFVFPEFPNCLKSGAPGQSGGGFNPSKLGTDLDPFGAFSFFPCNIWCFMFDGHAKTFLKGDLVDMCFYKTVKQSVGPVLSNLSRLGSHWPDEQRVSSMHEPTQ